MGVVDYFQNPLCQISDRQERSPKTIISNTLDYGILAAIIFSRYRDRSIYLRRLGEQTLGLAFPRKHWHG